MSKLVWDNIGERFFEAGVEKVVLYPYSSSGYGTGVAWNGVTAVNENPSGGEPSALWADNIKFANIMSAEDFGFTIEAYTYPKEWAECDGHGTLVEPGTGRKGLGVIVGQQKRKTFGLCYRTEIGSDTDEMDAGYKIHLIYGALASPSSRDHSTLNDSPDPETMSWDCTTTPVAAPGTLRPTAHIVIDSRSLTDEQLKTIEDKLYGVDADSTANPPVAAAAPELPLPDELKTLITG